jgi:DNA-directed RNA polymerase specialized sigma24 family protein
MRGEQDGAKISQAYQDHRPYLVDLAFRMLGDIGAAEDNRAGRVHAPDGRQER